MITSQFHKSHTSLVLCKNHSFRPWTVRTLSQSLFLQISGWSCLTSRRWKHSSSTHDTLPWLEHSWIPSSLPWWQYGQATHNSYCSPLRYGRSCDMVCKVPLTNSRTCVASSSDFSAETWWLCASKFLRTIFTKFFLQIRKKWWSCFPIKKQAPFWYSMGCSMGQVFLQHQRMVCDTSCENRPWGTKPCTKWRYKGQGSVWDSFIWQKSSGDGSSWAGTKYFTSLGEGENLAIKPNFSMMSKMSSLITPCWINLEKTSLTCSKQRMPFFFSSYQYLVCTGS